MGGDSKDDRSVELFDKSREVVEELIDYYMDQLYENNCKNCKYIGRCSEQVRALESARVVMLELLDAISDVVFEKYGIPNGVIAEWLYYYLDVLILRRKLTLVSSFGSSSDPDYGIYW